jgi:RNA polymerase sigma factor (sigma-70 family)
MAKKRNINEEDFNDLLAWLDPVRDLAGDRYESIRRSLIKIFIWRGYTEAEEMADETMDRVARNVKDIEATFVGNPTLYFYNVANKLMMEWARQKRLRVPLENEGNKLVKEKSVSPHEPEDDGEAEYECLGQCLEQLEAEDHALILAYYQHDKQAKIDHRRDLAQQMNVGLNALRVRVHRIRSRLEKCIENCLGQLQQ